MNLPPVPGGQPDPPAPPPPPPPRPVVPGKSLAGKRPLWITLGVALFVLIVVAVKMEPPTDATVHAFIKREMNAQGVKVETVWVEQRQVQGKTVSFKVNIQGRREKSTYYQPVSSGDTSGGLQGFAWEARDELKRLLLGKDGPRLRTLAGLTEEDEACVNAHLLREVPQASDSFWNQRATVTGARSGFSWQLSLAPEPGFDLSQNAMQPLDKFPGRRFVINRPEDRESLGDLSRRLEAIRERMGQAAKKLMAERRAGVLKMFPAGAFFTGTVTDRSPDPHREKSELFLEITESRLNEDPPRLTALIRNDGSWEDSRLFSGELDYDAGRGRLQLRLVSPHDEQRAGAGPLLSVHETDYYFAEKGDRTELDLAIVDGVLQWSEHTTTLRFEPASGANTREAVQARLTAQRQALIEATRPGRLYAGTITNRRTGASKPWLLQFDEQDTESATSHELGATLEPPDGAGTALALAGRFESNRYRAHGAPIQLEFDDADDERPEEFKRDEDAQFSDRPAADLALRPEGARLVGETPRLLFRFEPAPAALAAERRKLVEEKLAAAAQALLRFVRAGATFDGRPEGLPYLPEGVQLRFTKVEDRGAVVEVQLTHGKQTTPFETLTGRLVVGDKEVRFQRPAGENRRPAANRRDPQMLFERIWFMGGGELVLRIEESRLVLHPRTREHQSLVFPLKP